jgi:plasmid stability protein
MTLTLDLPPEIIRRLEEEAAQHGQTVSEYARMVLEQGLTPRPASRPDEEALTDLFAGIPRRSAEDLIALAREQGVKPVERFEDLLGDFWPEDESVDEFLEARRRWQWEGMNSFPYKQPKKRTARRADT